MPNEVKVGNVCRERLITGVNLLADIVKVTIGPKGRNVVIERSFGGPLITNDGVTIAKSLTVKDKYENLGIQILKEAAIKTNEVSGDGTTTSTVLAQAMVKNGLEALKNNEVSPMVFRDEMNEALNTILEDLKGISKEIRTNDEIYDIAKISSGSDFIAKLITDAVNEIGRDGVITVEESPSTKTYLTTTLGMEFSNGFISPYMAVNKDKMETVLHSPYVYISDRIINNSADLINILEVGMKNNRPVLIICKSLEGEALQTMTVNNINGTITAVAVKAPSYGENRANMLEDIAAICKGKVVGNDSYNINREDYMFTVPTAIIKKDSTTIVGDENNEFVIKRAEAIKKELEESNDEYDKEILANRLAKLVGGVATINVGAATEIEMKEMKLRIEDAINATKAAITEGIVPGSGAALVYCLGLKANTLMPLGYSIVYKSLTAPLTEIIRNTGVNYDLKNIIKTLKSSDGSLSINALTGKIDNAFETGIVDPVNVTKNALINAVSVASTLLTTEAAIIIDEDEYGGAPPNMSSLF